MHVTVLVERSREVDLVFRAFGGDMTRMTNGVGLVCVVVAKDRGAFVNRLDQREDVLDKGSGGEALST